MLNTFSDWGKLTVWEDFRKSNYLHSFTEWDQNRYQCDVCAASMKLESGPGESALFKGETASLTPSKVQNTPEFITFPYKCKKLTEKCFRKTKMMSLKLLVSLLKTSVNNINKTTVTCNPWFDWVMLILLKWQHLPSCGSMDDTTAAPSIHRFHWGVWRTLTWRFTDLFPKVSTSNANNANDSF